MPIEVDTKVPRQVDVVVVGGGLAGIATSLFLKEAGQSVVVCEKGRIGAEQSSRAFGWVSSLGDEPGRIELSSESKRLWRDFDDRFSTSTTYRETGLTLLCEDEASVAEFESWIDATRSAFGSDARIVSGSELARCLGTDLPEGWRTAVHQSSDASIEPSIATPALAAAGRRMGVTILEQCAVRGIETSLGRVSGVLTERGPIAASAIVIAGGSWSRLFCGNLGIHLPLLNVVSSMQRVSPPKSGPHGNGAGHGVYWRKERDGTYTLPPLDVVAPIVPDGIRLFWKFLPSLIENRRTTKLELSLDFIDALRTPKKWRLDMPTPFEKTRILDPLPEIPFLDRAFDASSKMFPGLADTSIIERWAGLIDSTPDKRPVIGEVPAIPGVYLCTGFSGHGLAMAPAGSKLVCDLINGFAPAIDPFPYRLSRFHGIKAMVN